MLQSYVLTDAFKRLYARYRPAFANVAPQNVAYMQPATGGPAERGSFSRALSLMTRRFSTVCGSKAYERPLRHWIERSLIWTNGCSGFSNLSTTVRIAGTRLCQSGIPSDTRGADITDGQLLHAIMEKEGRR